MHNSNYQAYFINGIPIYVRNIGSNDNDNYQWYESDLITPTIISKFLHNRLPYVLLYDSTNNIDRTSHIAPESKTGKYLRTMAKYNPDSTNPVKFIIQGHNYLYYPLQSENELHYIEKLNTLWYNDTNR